jgi:hypothetical protein
MTAEQLDQVCKTYLVSVHQSLKRGSQNFLFSWSPASQPLFSVHALLSLRQYHSDNVHSPSRYAVHLCQMSVAVGLEWHTAGQLMQRP